MVNQSPPNWAPNAIPTVQGWADPKTGELLVSKKGLINTVERFGKNSRPSIKPVINETALEIDIPDTLVENTFVELETSQPILSDPEEKKIRQPRTKRKA